MNHRQRRSVEVRWLMYWPPLAGELGRVDGRERQRGLCGLCLRLLADGERHLRKADESDWKLLARDYAPPKQRGTSRS